MKTNIFKTLSIAALFIVAVSACNDFDYEDNGPLQYQEETYSITDFDRLEMGDAFIVTVEQGNYFSVQARGDRRNIDDLEIQKNGNTLTIRFDEYENRQHETYIDIVMPTLSAAFFSGASNSVITGFDDLSTLSLYLSGASVSQIDASAEDVTVSLSGASIAELRGEAGTLDAEISGASTLKAFGFPVQLADLNVSGASIGRVTVSTQLDVVATGASSVVYRGTPQVNSEVSGASTLNHDN